MDYKSTEIKAGAFIFVSIVVLIIMIFMLGNLQDAFVSKKNVKISFRFAGGLEVGAPVRYAGLDVGRVADIRLTAGDEPNEDLVTVTTEINPAIELRQNSQAMIKTSGLMGGLYIDIRPGTETAPMLGEDESLSGQESFEFTQIGDMMERVVEQFFRFTQLADGLVKDSRDTLKTLQISLSSVNSLIKDNQKDFNATLKNIHSVSHELTKVLKNNGDKIRDTITHVASLAETADELLIQKSGALADIIDQTQRMTREMEILLADNRPALTNFISTMEIDSQKITTRIDSAAASLDETFSQSSAIMVENRRNLLELIKNLNVTSRNLKDLSADIKLNPWKLVRKDDEKLPEANQKLTPGNMRDQIRMKRLDKVSKVP